MNISNTCISIVWDNMLNIYGIRYSRLKDKSIIKAHCNSQNTARPFATRLEEVYKKLIVSKEDIVILGGHIKSAVCFNLKIPLLTIKEARSYLAFELSRYLPYPIDELQWWFRPIFSREKSKSKRVEKIKVFAVHKNIWHELISDLEAGGIKADAFMYPYMAVEPLFRDIDIYLEGINDSFYLRNRQEGEDSYMRVLPGDFTSETDCLIDSYEYFENKYGYLKMSLDDYLGNYVPNIILADYALSREFSNDKKNSLSLPVSMIPKRFRFLKIITIFLVLAFLLLGGTFIFYNSYYNYEAIKFLTKEKSDLAKALKKVDEDNQTGKKMSTLITTLFNSEPKDINLLKDLDVLSREIPGYIWVTNFNTYNDKINLALQSKGSSDQMISDFYKSSVFNLDNTRKRKSDDGFEYIYMSLSEKSDNQVRKPGETLNK